MRSFNGLILVSGFALFGSGCSSSISGVNNNVTDGGTDTGTSDVVTTPIPCMTTVDCSANEMCGFAPNAACGAQGTCFAVPASSCLAYSAGCSCDGKLINVACTGLPQGYTPAPLQNMAACGDAAPGLDAGGDATDHKDAGVGRDASDDSTTHPPGLDASPTKDSSPDDATTADTGADASPPAHDASVDAIPPVPDVAVDSNPPALDSGPDSTGNDAAPATPCTTQADCATGETCGFLETDACMAKGQCFSLSTGGVCQLYSPACSCDGKNFNIACSGLPAGYAVARLLHTGQCTDAGNDAGADDAGVPCTVSATCGANQVCGFPKKDLCNAKGQCVDATMAVCGVIIVQDVACACDGTSLDITCTNMPTGYVSKPIAHDGACVDGG